MVKKKKAAADAVAKEETKTSKTQEPMVTVIKKATASKLSPRGDGKLFYQVGRIGDNILLRISGNDSSGRFSKEWVGCEALQDSLNRLGNLKAFKGAVALKSAWKGKSSCNSGFGAGILKAEGVFTTHPDPKKKGMLCLSSPDALAVWEQKMLELPIPKDAETVLLHPPKPIPNFLKKKVVKDATSKVKEDDPENTDPAMEEVDPEDDPTDDNDAA
jgi:hypothetical protein